MIKLYRNIELLEWIHEILMQLYWCVGFEIVKLDNDLIFWPNLGIKILWLRPTPSIYVKKLSYSYDKGGGASSPSVNGTVRGGFALV